MKNIQSIVLRVAAVTMLFMVLAVTAFALDIKTARLNGLAGEVDNGLHSKFLNFLR